MQVILKVTSAGKTIHQPKVFITTWKNLRHFQQQQQKSPFLYRMPEGAQSTTQLMQKPLGL